MKYCGGKYSDLRNAQSEYMIIHFFFYRRIKGDKVYYCIDLVNLIRELKSQASFYNSYKYCMLLALKFCITLFFILFYF